MSEPQLERSVLEGKEREELFAIADALGTNPTSRARKGDLVAAILRATGVDVGEVAAPPRRVRARKSPSPTTVSRGDASADTAVSPQETGATESDSTELFSTDQGASDQGASDQGASKPGVSASSDSGSSVSGSGATTEKGESAAPTVDDGRAPRPEGSTGARQPTRSRTARSTPSGATPSTNGATTAERRGRNPAGPGQASPDTPSSGSNPATPDIAAPGAQNNATPGAVTTTGATHGTELAKSRPQGAQPQESQPQVSQVSGGDTSAETSGSSTSGSEGERPRFDADGGNRRNRRRRGRDRGDRPEREMPGQGQPDAPFNGEPLVVRGHLDLRDEGYGFLRANGYGASSSDVYVSISQVRRFALRKGDWIEGTARPATATEKYPALLRIDSVSGSSPEEARGRPRFDDLTPVTPDQRIELSHGGGSPLALRLMDLVSPLARGQRALLTGPPRSGRTGILGEVISSIENNHPDLTLMVLVVDERPEEVTELRRAFRTEVVATTFDRPPEEHVQVAELVLERAKRSLEVGGDVVLVVDGLTRLARAYNLLPAGTGRVLPGGIDAGALHHPKRFFAAARNIEGGGSLTILAATSVDTGSRTDEVIHEELAGAANMEMRLEPQWVRRRVFPAVDLAASYVRHPERLIGSDTMEQVDRLRTRYDTVLGDDTGALMDSLLGDLRRSTTNQEFLETTP